MRISVTRTRHASWGLVLLAVGLVSGVAGTLGTVPRPDGSTQVTHDGMPLYYYSGDTQAGQTNGQGVQGIWYVALAAGNIAAPASAAPASAAPAASGYSGY